MVTTTTISASDPAVAALPIPGGLTVATASAAELARSLVAAGVPDASHSSGKQMNADAYAKFVAKGKAEAGDAWHKAWIEQHGG